MKKIGSILVAAALATTLSGCIIVADHDGNDRYNANWKERQAENRELISELKIGSSIDSVTDKLGGADDSEGFTKDDSEYVILYYRTRHRHSDGETTLDETTPVVFKDGVLLGWGSSAMNRL